MNLQTPATSDPHGCHIDGPLLRKEALFEKAASTAYEAVLAISRNEEATARNHIDALRLYCSMLSTGEAHQSAAIGVEGASPLSLERMRCAVDAIQASQDIIARWIESNIRTSSGVADLDAQAWQRLFDHALPGSWNFETDLLLVFGPYDPGLVDALRERGQQRVLFVVHPDDSEEGSFEAGVYTPTPNIRVVRTEREVDLYMDGLKMPYPKHYASMDVSRGGVPRADDFDAKVHKTIMTMWMSVNTTRHFARNWVEQGITNMPAIAQHNNLRELDGAFRGRPAILISPGPSLDKNIAQLKAAQGKALLIAPLQSLRRLYKAGIQPDFVLVLDATDLTTEPYDFFNEVPADFLTTLIVGVNCHPRVVNKFKRVYFFSTSGPVDHWLEEMLSQPLVNLEAASVAISGLLLAQHWGCNPIVLTGQDLALADGGQRYAQDAQLNNLSAPKLMTLPGYQGGTVQTPSDYFLFHHQFERIAQRLAKSHPDVQLCNCTEGGAFIQGYQHRPLQEVLETHVLALPPADWVQRQVERDSEAQRLQRTASAVAHLTSIRQAVDACERQADKCRRLTMRPNGSAAFLKQLGAEEQRLRSLIKAIKGFSIVYQDQIDAALQAAASASSLQANLAASRDLYAVVSQGCVYIRPLVQQALYSLGLGAGAAQPSCHLEKVPLVGEVVPA